MAERHTYDTIMRDLKARKFYPVYILMGEEPYYIDLIADYIEENVLRPEERDFNQTIVYGLETNSAQVVDICRRFPMMSDYQVVILKEAQNMRSWDRFDKYFEKPLTSTILVICYRNKKLDARKSFMKKAAGVGVVFDSPKKRDRDLPKFIEAYVKDRHAVIEPKATQMIADFVGTDLSRLASEIDKVMISLSDDKIITPEIVESKIGISKDYNFFELRDAIVKKDLLKANRIVKYIDSNPKTVSLYSFLPPLFSFFQNLMIAHFSKDKSDRGVAEVLNLSSPWAAKDYVEALGKYNATKTMNIIKYIRKIDAKSKGIDNPNSTPGDLMKELIFYILH